MLPEIEKDHKVLKAVGFQNLLNLIGCLSWFIFLDFVILIVILF